KDFTARQSDEVRGADVKRPCNIQACVRAEKHSGRIDQKQVRPGIAEGVDRSKDIRSFSAGHPAQDIGSGQGRGCVSKARRITCSDTKEAETMEQIGPSPSPVGNLIDRAPGGRRSD